MGVFGILIIAFFITAKDKILRSVGSLVNIEDLAEPRF